MSFEKLIKDGKVAVLYSPGFGAGWSTLAYGDSEQAMAMDRDLVLAFLNGGVDALVKITEQKYPDNYTGGADDVVVAWLPEGTRFDIREYDGSETLHTLDNVPWLVA